VKGVIGIAEWAKEGDRNLIRERIDPLFEQFSLLHESYLNSFKTYRRMVSDPQYEFNNNHPVLEAIREDALLNLHHRMDLRNVVVEIGEGAEKRLADAILLYLDWDGDGLRTAKGEIMGRAKREQARMLPAQKAASMCLRSASSNMQRGVCYWLVRDAIQNGDRREEYAVAAIDELTFILQVLFTNVAKQYHSVRDELAL
jgi:hypothetical protein